MPPLTPISGKLLARLLTEEGFGLRRVSGSHHVFVRDGQVIVIPIHGNKLVGTGLLRKILRDLAMPVDEYEKKRQNL